MVGDSLFLDTAYVYALFNSRDQWHERAVRWQRKIAAENIPLLTTEFVLIEIANGLSSVKFRRDAADIIHALQDDVSVKIIPALSELFRQAGTLRAAGGQRLGLDRLRLVRRDD